MIPSTYIITLLYFYFIENNLTISKSWQGKYLKSQETSKEEFENPTYIFDVLKYVYVFLDYTVCLRRNFAIKL
jgi:hypothetical protein